jgi:ribonuclease P protein component
VNRKFSLTQKRDFDRVKKSGISVYHSLVILVYTQNELDISRAAIVASKKIGNAVTRNRVRRRIKACLHDYWGQVKPGWDLVFYSRAASVGVDFQDLKNAIEHLLNKASVL